jgi:transposase-like protein
LGHGSPSLTSYPLFRQRWFADDIIITCVRWYLRFKLSYRDLAELVRELGVGVAPSTILRWVIRYVPEFEKCWQAHERPVGDSWRVDETYLKVGGQWMYLYRAVDKQGKTVESYLSRTRDVTAAKAFFRKALKRHGEPRVITLDGFEPTHAALRRMGTAFSARALPRHIRVGGERRALLIMPPHTCGQRHRRSGFPPAMPEQCGEV